MVSQIEKGIPDSVLEAKKVGWVGATLSVAVPVERVSWVVKTLEDFLHGRWVGEHGTLGYTSSGVGVVGFRKEVDTCPAATPRGGWVQSRALV
jgi:hypothetical protein